MKTKRSTEITAKTHIQNIIDDMECIVHYKPYHAFALLAIIIEVMGKCMNKSNDWQHFECCGKDFNKALDIKSLNKYKTIDDKENMLYKTLRCGMAHAFLPKEGILLAPNRNNLKKKTIGCVSLYNDIKKAWKDIVNGKVSIYKDLDTNVLNVMNEVSGTTLTTKIEKV